MNKYRVEIERQITITQHASVPVAAESEEQARKAVLDRLAEGEDFDWRDVNATDDLPEIVEIYRQ